ncbi:hypothetical protein BGX29_007948 [Mortierella sp. GBA35]|nr:hypothetical protein BGX29_007948 [Mortierella sp. GBA35]
MPEYSSVLKSINARDDSLFMGPTGKAMFNHSKNHKRCILLAEGFYEWRRRGKERVPFYTRRRDGNLMLMAAIYDVAKVKEEPEPLYTYATITTNASPQLDWLHDRMPVLLSNNDHDKIRAWLDPNQKWNATLEGMLKPCVEFMEEGEERVYALETYQVDEKVNSVRNDSPDFTKPWNSSANKKTLNRFFFSKSESTSGDALPFSESSQAPSTSSTSSTTFKVEDDVEGKENFGDPNEQLDYADDDLIVVSDSAENPGKDNDDLAQQQVSVAADDSQRDARFEELEQQQDRSVLANVNQNRNDHEDRDLKLALELSRQDQASVESVSSPSVQVPLSTVSTLLSPTPSDPPPGQVSSSSLTGSVDLLEKRRQQRKQEEEEMEQVLEMSRLEAIADGHEDVGRDIMEGSATTTSTLTSALVPPRPDESREGATGTDVERQEAEELERAIAASLNDSATATSSPLSSPSTTTLSSPTHPKRSAPPLSPTASPRKRKPAGQSSPSSPAGSSPMKPAKKGKPSQDSKITNFFQHTTFS